MAHKLIDSVRIKHVAIMCNNSRSRYGLQLCKLQSAYNELRFDVGTVLTVHKYFVFRLLIFKQHG